MKGVTSNPALDAYHRVAATRTAKVDGVQAAQATHAVKPTEPNAARVQISNEARELAAHAGQVRTGTVQDLKAAVEAGTYKVNTHLVAQRLVEDLG
jgi:flagellar biosynthesis anti-sigma factor FlgM